MMRMGEHTIFEALKNPATGSILVDNDQDHIASLNAIVSSSNCEKLVEEIPRKSRLIRSWSL